MIQITSTNPLYNEVWEQTGDDDEPVADECPSCGKESVLWITRHELEEKFPADKTLIDKLDKFKGAGGGLNITFDAPLLGERIFYDPETDTLTIKGTPPNLKDQLIRR